MIKEVLYKGQFVPMAFEDIREKFGKMIFKRAHITFLNITEENKKIYGLEFPDLVQEMEIQAWEAFKRYDGKHHFSTYLHYRLMLASAKFVKGMDAKKRQMDEMPVSLDSKLENSGDGNDLALSDMIGNDDFGYVNIEFLEFIKSVEKTLNSEEKDMLVTLVDKKSQSVQDLADKWGITRVGANKRLNNFREKMKSFAKESLIK